MFSEEEIKREVILMKNLLNMKKVLKTAEDYAGEGVGGRRGEGIAVTAVRDYDWEKKEIPEKMIKKRGKLTKADIERGVLFTKDEIERIRRIRQIHDATDEAGKGWGSSQTYYLRRIIENVLEHQSNLFHEEKMDVRYDAVGRPSIKKGPYYPRWERLEELMKTGKLELTDVFKVIDIVGNEKTQKEFQKFAGKKLEIITKEGVKKLIRGANNPFQSNESRDTKIKEARKLASKYGVDFNKIIIETGSQRVKNRYVSKQKKGRH